MTERSEIVGALASKAVSTLVQEGLAANLEWTAIALACETVVAVVVITCADLVKAPDRQRWSTEIIDLITERAHERVTRLLQGLPPNG